MSLDTAKHPDWITGTVEILKALEESRANGTVIGITALSFGPVMVMAAVEDILEVRNDRIIVLKENDLLGLPIPETELLLSEIVRIHPFRTRYDDPFHVQLRETRREDI